MTTVDCGVVILTQGTRPEELSQAIGSVLMQSDVSLDIVCIGNGWEPTGLPAQVKGVGLPENIGIPAGRNQGIDHVEGEYIFFLDDDAAIKDPRFLAIALERLKADPHLGVIQGKVLDPAGSSGPSRWIPLLGSRNVTAPVHAFSLWEGAIVVRRDALDAAGRWPEPYFYAHEGVELAWRVWEQDQRVEYHPDLHVYHPVIDPRRRAEYFFLSARNRVWLGRRNLPWPLSVVYPSTWATIQTLRSLNKPSELRPWFRGFWNGWREYPARGKRMSWKTVARLMRRGRLLVI